MNLTQRETEVLRLIAGNQLFPKEVAARLGISLRTVEIHIQHLYRKLGLRPQLAQLTVWAVKKDFLPLKQISLRDPRGRVITRRPRGKTRHKGIVADARALGVTRRQLVRVLDGRPHSPLLTRYRTLKGTQ